MVFTEEKIKVKEGLLTKEYTITDEAKAAELSLQRELINAVNSLANAIRGSR